MIYSITLHPCGRSPKGGDDYFLRSLYKIATKEKKFTFTDGVNIIIGNNGSGKTTLLNILAGQMSIPESSMICQQPHSIWNLDKEKYKKYEDLIKNSYLCDSGYSIDVDIQYGNVLTYYLNDQSYDSENALSSIFGLGKSGTEQFKDMSSAVSHFYSYRSTGEEKIEKLLMFMEQFKPDRKFTLENVKTNSIFSNNDVIEYMIDWQNRHDDGTKPTLLIDEMDRGMDIINQWIFWRKIIPELSKKYQIIIVTHNLMSIKEIHYKPNIISFYPKKDYDFVKKIMKWN